MCYDPAQLSNGGFEMTRAQALKRAAREIKRKSTLAYDVAAENGQMFGNVAHMRWFLEAVADELQGLN